MTKGQVTEGHAVKAYRDAGYWVYKPERAMYGDNDVFGLFDLLAWHPQRGVVMCQVKTNRAAGIRRWMKAVEPFRRTVGCRPEFAVRHDSDGWRLFRPRRNGYVTAYDGRGWVGRNNARMIDTRFTGFLRNEVRR